MNGIINRRGMYLLGLQTVIVATNMGLSEAQVIGFSSNKDSNIGQLYVLTDFQK
ncbi:hypothetical protein L798_02801 [Zootermopsis nevadensis]|uniref:Uncharacterized protein n=1 Tax=Zootermopsis nevadensis TaxID=136037 RepID=A0A067RD02_ZOONE|nr:hypothetical protein L798_02801 [Zootermopsis nevadensis]